MENSKDPQTIIKWISQMCDLITNHGVWKAMVATAMLAFSIIIISFAIFPEKYIEIYDDIKTKSHTVASETRLTNDPIIRDALKTLKTNTDAQRAFVLEMRNGSSNISGLPYLYLDMKYEICDDDLDHIELDYTSINVSRYEFINYISKNKIWFGTIDELEKIDRKLALKMKSNDAEYLSLTLLPGSQIDIGFLGITYTSKNLPKSITEINKELMYTGQKICVLLDGNIKK